MTNKRGLTNGQFTRFLVMLVAGVFLLTTLAVVPASAMKPGAWLAEWKDTKTEFEAKTGKKKPAKKVLGAFRKSSGVEKSLKKLDKTFAAINSMDVTFKAVSKFEKALKSFDKTKNKYIKKLEKALDKEKNADSAYAKGLKILKSDLKAISAAADGQLEVYKKASESGKISREAFDAGMVKILIGTIKDGKTFCKRVLSETTAEDQMKRFNKGIQKSARNVTQNLTNIVKKMDDGDKRKKTGANLSKVLTAWGNQGRKLPGDATQKQVKREVGAYNQALKGASKWAKSLD